MIRINLLTPERAPSKSKTKAAPSGAPGSLQSVLLFLVFVGGAFVLCAGAWWWKSDQLKKLDERIAQDRQREQQLQAIKRQVDEFQQKKTLLESKVKVIEQLRLAQKSPVHMLDEISRALPDYVWLTDMDETRGAIKLGGESNSLAAVADFMAALQRSGWFPQVELASAQEQAAGQAKVVKFEITGAFKDPEQAAREKEEAAKAAAPRPPAVSPTQR